jgi:hypothetical protein
MAWSQAGGIHASASEEGEWAKGRWLNGLRAACAFVNSDLGLWLGIVAGRVGVLCRGAGSQSQQRGTARIEQCVLAIGGRERVTSYGPTNPPDHDMFPRSTLPCWHAASQNTYAYCVYCVCTLQLPLAAAYLQSKTPAHSVSILFCVGSRIDDDVLVTGQTMSATLAKGAFSMFSQRETLSNTRNAVAELPCWAHG